MLLQSYAKVYKSSSTSRTRFDNLPNCTTTWHVNFCMVLWFRNNTKCPSIVAETQWITIADFQISGPAVLQMAQMAGFIEKQATILKNPRLLEGIQHG